MLGEELEQVYRAVRPELLRMLVTRGWQKADAEELIQDMFVELLVNADVINIRIPIAFLKRRLLWNAADKAQAQDQHQSNEIKNEPYYFTRDDVASGIQAALSRLDSREQLIATTMMHAASLRECSGYLNIPLTSLQAQWKKIQAKLQTSLAAYQNSYADREVLSQKTRQEPEYDEFEVAQDAADSWRDK